MKVQHFYVTTGRFYAKDGLLNGDFLLRGCCHFREMLVSSLELALLKRVFGFKFMGQELSNPEGARRDVVWLWARRELEFQCGWVGAWWKGRTLQRDVQRPCRRDLDHVCDVQRHVRRDPAYLVPVCVDHVSVTNYVSTTNEKCASFSNSLSHD